MLKDIVAARALGGYRLHLRFANGADLDPDVQYTIAVEPQMKKALITLAMVPLLAGCSAGAAALAGDHGAVVARGCRELQSAAARIRRDSAVCQLERARP
jgi:hypothetical protein